MTDTMTDTDRPANLVPAPEGQPALAAAIIPENNYGLPVSRSEEPAPFTLVPQASPAATPPSAAQIAEAANVPAEAQAAPLGLRTQADPDALWEEYVRVRAERRGLIESKAQHDIRMLVQIAWLFECHAGSWSYFQDSKKIPPKPPQAKSDFHSIVMHSLGETADRKTGRPTVCCCVLDTWARTSPRVPPNEIPKWLKENGGPDGIYKAQRALKNPTSTRDQKDAAFHRLVELGPIASFPLPPALAQFGDGDQVVLAHFDCIKGKLDIKGVVRKVDQAWLIQNAEAIVASRSVPIPGPTKPTGPIDEYMTKDEVAAHLYEGMLDVVRKRPGFKNVTRNCEPSVGEGAFFKLMGPDALGIDIAPKIPGVIEHDFLTFTQFGDHTYLTAGNVPFSKGAAVKFFNHAARVSAYIAFVVAGSFANRTTQNKLDRHFHLIATLPVPDMAFVHGGKAVHVPGTIFQIWERRDELRKLIPRDTPEECADLEFLPTSEGADYIMVKVGPDAGRSIPLGSKAPASSHWFIRCDEAASKILNSINWPPPVVGIVRHLGKPEIIKMYNVKKRATQSKFVH